MNGRLDGFSQDRLMRYLRILGDCGDWASGGSKIEAGPASTDRGTASTCSESENRFSPG
ncbi:MAG: hypothetical protein IIC18_07045 [Bacteroidetes bacterium]|nr:hypothetical protein [Bacteroidota bacterium]